jgi:hypothetical protein
MVHTRAQANRDAALIAAAPDLLERALAEIERLRTRAACEEIKAVAAERRADELRAEAGRLRESLVNTQMALDIVTASVENARRG